MNKEEQGFYSILPDKKKKKICLECLRKAEEEQDNLIKKAIMNKEENKIKVGSTIFIEQAWEDNRGNYHDEYAEVLSIDDKGFMKLKFPTKEITKFLDGAEYNIKDYQDCVN